MLSAETMPAVEPVTDDETEVKSDAENEFEDELARLDALLDRSSRLLAQPAEVETGEGQGRADLHRPRLHRMVTRWYTIPNWDEDARMERWLAVHDRSRDLPPLLAAAVVWDAWEDIEPLQHQHWLGPMLVSAMLQRTGQDQIASRRLQRGIALHSARSPPCPRSYDPAHCISGSGSDIELGKSEGSRAAESCADANGAKTEGSTLHVKLPGMIDLILSTAHGINSFDCQGTEGYTAWGTQSHR